MPLPPCVMRESRLAPDGKTYDFCRHPDFPHQLRLLAHYPDICQACPLRQTEGTRPPLVDPEAYTPGKLRPDLTAIERTLPPPDGQERTFQRPVFESDGAITYPKRDGDWEPPQEPSGYIRDPNNAWRFLPLWRPCGFRLAQGFIKVACGCLGITMRCNQPKTPIFGQQLGYMICKKCPHRS